MYITKMKRSYPLDDEAKARIIGWDSAISDEFSSGSDHSGPPDDDFTSSTLSELFYGFSLRDAAESSPECRDTDSDRDSSMYDSIIRNVDLIEPILLDRTDEFRNLLRSNVLEALQVFSFVKSDKQMLRRNVMAFLRNRGYDAAVCKTKWLSSGGLTAGSYEFVDVLRKDFAARYFVDLDFTAEFAIARPTDSYERLLQCLPAVFVGTSDDLKQILKAMSDAGKRSLKSGGLRMPPWRKHRFLQNKWLGPYRRTANLFPTSFCSATSSLKRSLSVKRCAVGFNAAANGARLLCPSAARTR